MFIEILKLCSYANNHCYNQILATIWLQYCRRGVKHQSINQYNQIQVKEFISVSYMVETLFFMPPPLGARGELSVTLVRTSVRTSQEWFPFNNF